MRTNSSLVRGSETGFTAGIPSYAAGEGSKDRPSPPRCGEWRRFPDNYNRKALAPLQVYQGVPAKFGAAVQPLSTTLPLTYTWRATGQAPVVHANVFAITDAVSFTWTLTRTRTITVTAANAVGVATKNVVISVMG